MAKETITRIPLDRLAESSMNPRRIRNAEIDGEFADSIKARGILVPLIVRKNGKGYEILAGSRRFRAAKKLKFKDVPVKVIEATEDAAREIIIVENLQRADVHPLDEADGFADLLEKSNGDFGKVSAKVNKPRAYIAKMARLSNLSKSWRKEWLDPETRVTVDHAVQLARLEHDAQEALFKRTDYLPNQDELRKMISDEHLFDLRKVPWDLKDAALDKKAGPCVTCPKRTGSNADLFSDIKGANVCTDRICFNGKLRQHGQAEALKVSSKLKFHLLSDEYYNREKGVLDRHDWNRITTKKDCDYTAIGVVVTPGSKNFGKVWKVCLGGQKCKDHRGGDSYAGAERPKISKEERKKRMAKNRGIRRRLEENNVQLDHVLSKWKVNLRDLKQIAAHYWERLWHDSAVKIAMRRGWIQKRSEMGYGHNFTIEKVFLNGVQKADEIFNLMLETILASDLGSEIHTNMGPDLKRFTKELKVDEKAIKRDVDAAEKKREIERTARRKSAAAERVKLKAKAKGKKSKAKVKGKPKAATKG